MSEFTAGKLSKILKEHKRWCDTDGDEGEKAFLCNANLSRAYLSNADLRETNMSWAKLFKTDLSGADLRRANLSGAYLGYANLSGAKLSEAKLSEANLKEASLRRANLRHANLSDAKLSGTNLSKANLSKANLSNAKLSDADLSSAKLRGANLNVADLINVNLAAADLRETNMSWANLRDAWLKDADLSGADLTQVYNLSINELSDVRSLYKAELDPELKKQVRKKYPHLLEEPEEEDQEEEEDEEKLSKSKIITLRSSYPTLSVSQVQSMPNVSISKKKEGGFFGHSTINHIYNLKTIRGDKVVVDNATDLMWHQSGYGVQTNWGSAKQWVEDLNSEGYAGYHDWRLPTVDEAVSLLESNAKNGDLYIDPVFSKKQKWIWTGDKFEDEDGSEAAWRVFFLNGRVCRSYIYFGTHVRPVRSVE